MAKRNVIWTKTADIQFAGILEYWVERNKSNLYSKKLVKLVAAYTNQIAKNPKLYKSADFENTRVATLGNFSLYYKIAEKELVVTAFWDNRQNPEKLLEVLRNRK